uniref:pyridoxal 5'-phosphate synthase n=1 Tax=Clastoptera arizonana TaxID=38151 RepID=A0A1B6BY41_9HEMI
MLFKSPIIYFRKSITVHRYLKMSQGLGDVKVKDMRAVYNAKHQPFLEDHLTYKEPFGQFKVWFEEASRSTGILEPNAMCLATVSRDGRPSARHVLLKGFGKDGFKFFTNYNSRKAQDMEVNNNVALTFYWEVLHRCIRIEGKVYKISASESDEYFNCRPRDSQIGSSVSNQSSVVQSRDILIQRELQLKEQYKDQPVPRPSHWGGYVVIPDSVEFWSGQSDRIHDRILFRKTKEGEVLDQSLTHVGDDGWVYERLSP